MAESARQKAEILDQFTRQAEGYAHLTESLKGRRRSPVIDAAIPRPDDVALDVCCGAGSLTLALAPHVARITGLDLTEAMLEQARAAQSKAGVNNVEGVRGTSDQLPFSDGVFTLVSSSAAFHHLERPADTLAEMARVCAPGGRVVIMDFAFANDGKAAAFDETERLRDPSHVHAFTLSELRALAEGLPLRERSANALEGSTVPFEMVLATSHPTACTIDVVRDRIAADARSGLDRHGLNARLSGDEIVVTYPQAVIVWEPVSP